MERRPVRLPPVRRDFAEARNSVLAALAAGPAGRSPLDVLGETLGFPLRLLGVEPAPAGDGAVPAWCVHLRGEGRSRVALLLPDRLAGAVVAAALGADSWAMPAGDGGEALAGVLCFQTLRCLAGLAAAGLPLELVDLHRPAVAPGEPVEGIALSLRLLVGDVVGCATLRAGPPGAPRHTTARPPWLDDVPVVAALVLASGRLRRGELRALRPGDAVVLEPVPESGTADAAPPFPPQAARLAAGPVRWPCRAAPDGRWKIAGPATGPQAGRKSMATTQGDDRTEVMARAADGVPLDDVPIEVTAVAGHASLTVGALALLGPGSVVPLGRSAGGTVELLANGMAFARGRLIDLDGELAVEIADLRADR